MGSKTETKTQQTQVNDPWAQSMPFLNDTLQGAHNTYNSDAGRDYFPNATYVPASGTTQNALNQIENRASNGSYLNSAAQDSLLNYINGNRQNPANDFYQGGMDGNLNVSTDNYQQFMNGSQNPANDYFNDVASGNNPHIDAQFTNAADKVSDQVNSVFSKAGRYGSIAHQGQLANDIGNMANNFYGAQYNADQDRRMNAAGAISNDYNTNIGQQMNAAGSIANIQGANAGNQLNAANAYSNNYNQMDNNQLSSIGMANSVANSDYQDLDRLLGVGAAREGYDAQALQDQINRFNYEENNPIAREQQFAQLAALYGGLGGTSNMQGTTTEKTSGLGATIGNIGAGLGLGASLIPGLGGATQAMGSPAQMAMMPMQSYSPYSQPMGGYPNLYSRYY